MSAIESPKKSAKSLRDSIRRRPSAVSSHQDEVVATQLARDALNRDRYQFLVNVNYGLSAGLFVTCAALVYLALQPVQTKIVVSSPDGAIREIVPETRPVQSPVEVLNWATTAVSTSLTMAFGSYETQMADSRLYFTDVGWRGYEEAMTRSGMLTRVIAQKLTTTAVPTSAPVIVWEGINRSGRYGWRVQVPMVVNYQSASGVANQTFNVELVVTRRPETEHPSGLGIDQFVAR